MEKTDAQASTPAHGDRGRSTGAPVVKVKGRPARLKAVLPVMLCLGWLSPIIALLVLNFKQFIAGASIYCGVRNCNDYTLSLNFTQTSEKLDRADHNILGVLQLVAKALEIWFVFLAGSLIFDITMLLARRGDGLPMRYLVVPTEFKELASWVSKTLWTAPDPLASRPVAVSPPLRTQKRTIYLFILFALLVCAVCNLMGPATAVLLLPTLVWREVDRPENQALERLGVSSPPTSSELLYCLPSDFAAGRYSCLNESMGSLSTLSANLINQIGAFAFSFNLSDQIFPLIPNQNAIFDYLQNDYIEWSYAGEFSNYSSAAQQVAELPKPEFTYGLYKALRNAQQVILQRQAPAFLFSSECFLGVVPSSAVDISADKAVRCFPEYILPYRRSFARRSRQSFPERTTGTVDEQDSRLTEEEPIGTCIRLGTGWGVPNAVSHFSLMNSSSAPTEVSVYSSNWMIYMNASTYQCVTEKSHDNSCNWDALFAEGESQTPSSQSVNPLITEYIWSDRSYSSRCTSLSYLRYPTYVLDTSPSSNPFTLVTLTDNSPFTEFQDPVFVHPDWILAAWQVDRGGEVSNPILDGSNFIEFIDAEVSNTDDFTEIQQLVMAQALSISDYTLKNVSASAHNPPEAPNLKVDILVYVWSYGLSSRTSRLGAVVAFAGCVIVVIKMAVSLTTRTVPRETLDYVMIGLEQRPPGLFRNIEEKRRGNVRFRMANREDAEFEFT